MKHLGPVRLIDVLAQWGRHEAAGRFRDRREIAALKLDGADGAAAAANVVLMYRAAMVSMILGAEPRGCATFELAADDIPALHVFDGRTATEYSATLLEQRDASGDHVRKLAAGESPPPGHLVCAAQASDAHEVIPPIIVYDGCHRLAAWIAQLKARPRPIRAHLVATRGHLTIFRSS